MQYINNTYRIIYIEKNIKQMRNCADHYITCTPVRRSYCTPKVIMAKENTIYE